MEPRKKHRVIIIEELDKREREIEFDSIAEAYKAYYLLTICMGRVADYLKMDKGKIKVGTYRPNTVMKIMPEEPRTE